MVEGAREAVEWARGSARLLPLAVVHPAFYGRDPDDLIRTLVIEGIRAVAVLSSPAYYPVEWDSPAVRAIGRAAATASLPLQAGVTSETELPALLRGWGDLPVPVMVRWMAGHRYRALASEIAIAKTAPHFLFDVGNMASIGMLGHAIAAIGAERLFFASNSPYNIAAARHAVLADARIDGDARAAVAWRTATAALRATEVAPDGPFGAPWLDPLARRPKIDIHWHIDGWGLGELGLGPEEQLEAFDRSGYERVVVSSVRALNDDLAAGNRSAAEWCGRDERVRALIVVDPLRRRETAAAVATYADDPRFVGLKTIQDLPRVGLDDPAYDEIFDAAHSARLPLLAHLPGAAAAARRHPEVTIVAAHANRKRVVGDVPENLCFDTATAHALAAETQLRRFIADVGSDRVLFGSDGPLVSPAWSLGKLVDAELAEGDLERVMRGNALRIFDRIATG